MGARHGQHFLRNRGAIDRILERFGASAHDAVVELGPGRGALTRELAARAGALGAVEIDPALASDLAHSLDIPLMPQEALRSRLPSPDTRRFILRADATDVRYEDLAPHLGASPEKRIRVIGNLPYVVATALVRRALAERHLVAEALVMVQKEVADRLLADPGSKDYGFLTVLLALASERRRLMTLEPGSFEPPPRVRSSVVSIAFHRPGPGFRDEDARLEALLRASFTERRKKVASNLAKAYGLSREEAAGHLAACGADPEARAEILAPAIFARLAETLPFPPPGAASGA
jgi:16S rRNA (adenine1518-N6/adenine1519-N6)-dimethyltransferase